MGKKWRRFCLSLALLGLLAGCAPAAPAGPAGRPSMTVWLRTSFTPLADELQKRYVLEWANAKGVEVIIVQDSVTVLEPQFNAGLETKNLPDVLEWASPEWAPKLQRLGLALDLTDVVTKMKARGGGLYDSAITAVTQDSKQFAAPTYGSTEVFYVRKDLLDAKGLQPPDSWEDVVKVAKATTDTGKVWGWGAQIGTASYDSEYALLAMFASYGASPFAADGKTPNLNNDGAKQALAVIKDAWDAGAIPQDVLTWDDGGNNRAYLTKAVAMTQNTGSILAAYRKDDPDLTKNSVVIRVPRGPKGRVLINPVYGFMAANTSKYPDLSRDLVDYLADVERQGKIMEAAGANYLSMYKDLAKRPMWEDPQNQLFISQLPDTHAVGYPGPTTEWALEAWRTHTMAELVSRVIVEKRAPEDALKEAETKVTGIYERFNRR